jgi:hypothetical protein
MFITNPESLNKDELFPCKSLPLMRFLCQHMGLNYIARESFIEKKDGKQKTKQIWFFVKTPELQSSLQDWALRKPSN